MKAHIFTSPIGYNETIVEDVLDEDIVIGADKGSLAAIQLGYHLHLALGDFDSVSSEERKTIEYYADEMMVVEIKKDYTDTYLAVQEAFLRGYDEIIIYGGLGKRFDHSYANVMLCELGDITIKTMHETIYTLDPGEYNVWNNYSYISFFALEDVTGLTLTGFEYDLDQVTLLMNDPLCISNQGSGTLKFDEGVLLVIHQNED